MRDVSGPGLGQRVIAVGDYLYRTFETAASDGVCIFDADGNRAYVSPSICQVLGYTTEELIAVVVTNIFMTDPSNTRSDRVGLRRDHGFGKLESARSDSLAFFRSSQNAFNRIEQFCREDRWFTERLAETRATYNPVMVYYQFQTAARKASSSTEALLEDAKPRR